MTDAAPWPPALFWLSSYVARHHLAVVPQSGAKDLFYCTVYYITLVSNCESQRASKNLIKFVEDRVRSPNSCMGDLSEFFLSFREKMMFKSHLIK